MQRNTENTNGFLSSILNNVYDYFFSSPSQPSEKIIIEHTINTESKPSELKIKSIDALLEAKKQPPQHLQSLEVRVPTKIIAERQFEVKIYNQATLQKKIEIYLNKKLGNGYCNGLTLLWLYKMAEHQEHWFYAMNEKIINCPIHKLSEIAMDIEKFYAHIEWAQNSDLYSKNMMGEAQVKQRDLNKILEIEKMYSNKKNKSFSITQLRAIFNKYVKDDVLISLGTPPDFEKKEDGHVIGVMQRKYKYYLYDGNYSNGRAKVFEMTDFEKLYKEIQYRLYQNVNRYLPQNDMILEIDIARITRQKSLRLAEKRERELKSLNCG